MLVENTIDNFRRHISGLFWSVSILRMVIDVLFSHPSRIRYFFHLIDGKVNALVEIKHIHRRITHLIYK
jgi:hypothetical protein